MQWQLLKLTGERMVAWKKRAGGMGSHDADACSTAARSLRSTREKMKLPVPAKARMAERNLKQLTVRF